MKDRIEVNGIWYVRETKVQEELFVTDYDGTVFENDLFSLEVTRLKGEDGLPTEDIYMDYTSKVDPYVKECWDSVDWMIGVYRNNPTSVRALFSLMPEGQIKQLQSIIGTLIDKGWIENKTYYMADL